jgi:hypothetical protein
MPVRAVDDKPSDTLVVVSAEGFWTGSSTLPHLHHIASARRGGLAVGDLLALAGLPYRSARVWIVAVDVVSAAPASKSFCDFVDGRGPGAQAAW